MRYFERLSLPPWGWLLAVCWPATLGIAYGYALGALVGWLVTGVLLLLVVAWLLAATPTVEVVADQLRVGRATISASHVGTAEPHGRMRTRELTRSRGDARAFLTIRGWIESSVQVAVIDQLDPTPYWLISTRKPEQLADAINAMRMVDHNTPDRSWDDRESG